MSQGDDIFARGFSGPVWFCAPFSFSFLSGSSGFCEDMRVMYEY